MAPELVHRRVLVRSGLYPGSPRGNEVFEALLALSFAKGTLQERLLRRGRRSWNGPRY